MANVIVSGRGPSAAGLNDIGGLELMEHARERVKRKLKLNMASHLDYAWAEIGKWAA